MFFVSLQLRQERESKRERAQLMSAASRERGHQMAAARREQANADRARVRAHAAKKTKKKEP